MTWPPGDVGTVTKYRFPSVSAGNTGLLDVVAGLVADGRLHARYARQHLDRAGRGDEAAAEVAPRVPEDLDDVPLVELDGEAAAAARPGDAVARDHRAALSDVHGDAGAVLDPADDDVAAEVRLRPAALAGDAVVARHRGARQEQRRVVGEGEAAEGFPVVGCARLVARAGGPVLPGRAALPLYSSALN